MARNPPCREIRKVLRFVEFNNYKHSVIKLLRTSNFIRYSYIAVQMDIVKEPSAIPAILLVVLGTTGFSLRRDER
jgi:hypothetical protein